MARRGVLSVKCLGRKSFGLVPGLFVFLGVLLVGFSPINVFLDFDRSISDFLFKIRFDTFAPQFRQVGTVLKFQNTKVNSDILILGVDSKSLNRLGKWPFSRNFHADLLNCFSRIEDQSKRERAVFFDFFFLEKEPQIESDLALTRAIQDNQRVFLGASYSSEMIDQDASSLQYSRLQTLIDRSGQLINIEGDWKALESYPTIQAPLIPLAKWTKGYGFATFTPDSDKIFRRQNLVSKISKVLEEYELDKIKPDLSDYGSHYIRYTYTGRNGIAVTLPEPLTQHLINTLPGLMRSNGLSKQVAVPDSLDVRSVYTIQKIQDVFVPSITLALALEYWHKKPADIQVVLGSYIRIISPEIYDSDTGTWRSAPFEEVRIPIDGQASMAINFMGPASSENADQYQTFPERPYSSYSAKVPSTAKSSWPKSMQLDGKILMVGPFSSGMADDVKNTPYGQMFGVEIHANALNTILTRNFLRPVPSWIAISILFCLVFLISILALRIHPWASLLGMAILIIGCSTITYILFDDYSIIYPYTSLYTGIVLSYISSIGYRVLTEESEKRQIRDVFSKYVSPDVVSELLLNPPELGGVAKELTVLFSDIREFTSISEIMTSQELVSYLNDYLTIMTDIIHEYHGTLDKYVGDEIMCFWGAPLTQVDHAELAAKCALKMIGALENLNRRVPEEHRIKIGIGINSGVMTVGNMGSPGRMNYTLMGDNVNLAARLEGVNKEYQTNIVISEMTYQHIKSKVTVRELDNILVKGKSKAVLIYELIDFTEGNNKSVVDKK